MKQSKAQRANMDDIIAQGLALTYANLHSEYMYHIRQIQKIRRRAAWIEQAQYQQEQGR